MRVWDREVMDGDAIGSGCDWLDAVQRYISQISIIVQDIHNGALIDLHCFMESGWADRRR